MNQLEGIEKRDGRDEIEAIWTDNKELDINKSWRETRIEEAKENELRFRMKKENTKDSLSRQKFEDGK